MEHPRTRTTPPPSDGEYDGMDGYDGDNTDNDPYDEENGNDYGLSEHDGLIDVASNAISQCPIENGVMRTYWGSISAGPLIGGHLLSVQTFPCFVDLKKIFYDF